jgi:hypothetical protein
VRERIDRPVVRVDRVAGAACRHAADQACQPIERLRIGDGLIRGNVTERARSLRANNLGRAEKRSSAIEQLLTRRHLTGQARHGNRRLRAADDNGRCGNRLIIQRQPPQHRRTAQGQGCQHRRADAREDCCHRPTTHGGWGDGPRRQHRQRGRVERLECAERPPADHAALQMLLHNIPLLDGQLIVEQRGQERIDLVAIHRAPSIGRSFIVTSLALCRRLNILRAS